MKNKKLFLIPLVLSSETAHAISTEAVRTALSNYCVPYSETSPSNNGYYQKFNKPVCGSVFEANYAAGPKCDCSTGSKSYTSDYTRVYSDLGKYLSYDTTTRRCEPNPSCPNRYKVAEFPNTTKTCPTGTFQDKITKTGKSEKEKKYIQCEACTYPANATWAADTGCDWKCKDTGDGDRYKKTRTCKKKCNAFNLNCIKEHGLSALTCLEYSDYYCTSCTKPNSHWTADSGCDFACNAGYYKNGDSCTACPAGTYSAAGATSCTSCPSGTYSRPGSVRCSSHFCSEVATYNSAGTRSITLNPGTYKVWIHGARGGDGGDTGICYYVPKAFSSKYIQCADDTGPAYGGSGGYGECKSLIFNVSSSASYTLKVGSDGTKGSYCNSYEKNFVVNDKHIDCTGGTGTNGEESSFGGVTATGGGAGTGGQCKKYVSHFVCPGSGQGIYGYVGSQRGSNGTNYSECNLDAFVSIYQVEDTTKPTSQCSNDPALCVYNAPSMADAK